MNRTSDIVGIGERILVTPETLRDLRCTAATQAGRRCRAHVEPSQTGAWEEVVWTGGRITVYRVPSTRHAAMLEQRCARHAGIAGRDDSPPEWQPFDPTGVHADLVAELPTEPRLRPLREWD